MPNLNELERTMIGNTTSFTYQDGRLVEISESSDEVDAKLEQLDQLWNRLERRLLRRQPPRDITVEIHRELKEENGKHLERRFLGIQRQRGVWRLCFAVDWSPYDEREPQLPSSLSWKPIIECDYESRVFASQHVEKLKVEIDNSTNSSDPQLDSAISLLEAALSKA